MQTNLKGRDYISTQDWTVEELETALQVSWDLKRRFALGEALAHLQHLALRGDVRREERAGRVVFAA